MVRARSRSDIDIEKLRKKYSRPRADLQAEASRDVRRDVLSSSEQKMTEVTMCQACQAHGTVQRQYGFRVLTEVCEQCNGEGCFIKGQGKLASMELKEKVAKVEELIAACEDIDELEELEAALKDKSMVKLDAVLKKARMKMILAREAELAAEEAAKAAAAETSNAQSSSDSPAPAEIS